MDKTEAKLILQTYRPNGHDNEDPRFAQALELARNDAELGTWFAEQQAFDHAIAKKLSTVTIPADLRASILAGKKIASPDVPAWQRYSKQLAAIAAMLLLLLLPFALMQKQKPPLAKFKSDAVTFLDELNRLDMSSRDTESIRAWLTTHGGQRRFDLPAKLAQNPSIGCRIYDWKGQKVTLICFNITPKGGKFDEVHLLVLDASQLRDAPTGLKPCFETVGNWKTACWQEDGLAYVLAGTTSSTTPIESFF